MTSVCRIVSALLCAGAAATAAAEPPAFESMLEGFDEVRPANGDEPPFYRLYLNEKTRDLYAVLPKNHEDQMVVFADGVAGGYPSAGTQGSDDLVYWKRFGDRIAMMYPQLGYRTSGDRESERSIEVIYTDRVLADMPIAAITRDGEPVIDLDELLIDRVEEFHSFNPGYLDANLAQFGAILVFPENVLIEVVMPWRDVGGATEGRLITVSFSFALMPEDPGYTPREADQRVGYFHTAHTDISRFADATSTRRLIHRWKLEKADPSLDLSPARDPIVFYIDHKTPIRYRRWVREGILEWNKAFEAIGFSNAIEVYQQDAVSGAHMDKRPEDVRYNFFIWNSTDWGFAMGPMRTDPRTGQVFDADVIFHDGWIRDTRDVFERMLAEAAVAERSEMSARWLAARPEWNADRRLAAALGAEPVDRVSAHERGSCAGGTTAHGHASRCLGCAYATHRAADVALARLRALAPMADDDFDVELFIGQQVKDVTIHELGHALGLRHNFKASSVYSVEQISSPEWHEEGRPISGSVMDYNAGNYLALESWADGSILMTTLGPYDYWAIRFGYGPEEDREEVLAQADRPEHAYLTDEDLYGPDPAAAVRDLGADALEFVDRDMAFIREARAGLIDRVLDDGDSYQKVRDAYLALLMKHRRNLITALRYVGGIHAVRVTHLAEGGRTPVKPLDAETQRRALRVLDRHAFRDDAFGLSPDLMSRMTYDRWFDDGWVPQGLPDPQLAVHEVILAMQARVLTGLFQPEKLARIADSAFLLEDGQDAFTIAELFSGVRGAVWSELDERDATDFSSLRHGLQSEHVSRMIDLSLGDAAQGAVGRRAGALASSTLRELAGKIDESLSGRVFEPETEAHLRETRERIARALSAQHVVGAIDSR